MTRNKGNACSVDQCSRSAHCRGWCTLHYKRWTHTGDPTKTLITPRGERLATLHELMALETDDCVLWPFTPTSGGYGAVTIDGRTIAVHVYVCIACHGLRPKAQLHAAHSCGHRLCVNRRHIRWATPTENAADTEIHGTRLRGDRHPRSKISEAVRAEIHERWLSGESLSSLSREYSIARGSIRRWRAAA